MYNLFPFNFSFFFQLRFEVYLQYLYNVCVLPLYNIFLKFVSNIVFRSLSRAILAGAQPSSWFRLPRLKQLMLKVFYKTFFLIWLSDRTSYAKRSPGTKRPTDKRFPEIGSYTTGQNVLKTKHPTVKNVL